MPTVRVADVAKRRLSLAARRLGTQNPVEAIGGLLDRSFDLPLGDPRYRDNALLPGALPLEHSFSEIAADTLRLDMEPLGPNASPASRQQEASREMRRLVQGYYGRGALDWFDQHSEPWRGSRINGAARFGAWFGAAFDGDGLREAKVYYELGPGQLDDLPYNLQHVARVAMSCLPGLVPIFTSVACGRSQGAQRIYFYHQGELRLLDLEPLMNRLGIGHQLPGLLTAIGLILGGRFTLPDGAVVLSFRDTSRGIEMKLEILLPAIPAGVAARAAELDARDDAGRGRPRRGHDGRRRAGDAAAKRPADALLQPIRLRRLVEPVAAGAGRVELGSVHNPGLSGGMRS
jgi:hypothetical protein